MKYCLYFIVCDVLRMELEKEEIMLKFRLHDIFIK